MTISDIIKVSKLFKKERRIKAIRVSKEFYEYIKKNFGAPEELIAKAPSNFIDRLGGVPIVIDDDVETWEVEYEKEGE